MRSCSRPGGSAAGLVVMAFLSVVREGLETAVFLLAAFQASGDAIAAGIGATLGVLVAAVIGFGIYRGGVRLNLGRFFRATSVVLVLVAAGLVASAIHTAHEAAWLNGLQAPALDLAWLVRPGTWTSSLLTGMLGLQPTPTVGEVGGWLLFAVPMLLYVLWPDRWRNWRRKKTAAVAGLALLTAVVLAACGRGSSSGGGSSAGSGASAGSSGGARLAVKLVDAGCAPARITAPAGKITFSVTNGGTSKVSELEVKDRGGIILGERENVVAGLSGELTLNLKAGTYVLNCPNGSGEDNGRLVVSGTAGGTAVAADAPAIARAVSGYRAYVLTQTDELLAGTKRFARALDAGELEQAKELFGPLRSHYEAIEPVAESFGDLDPQIDARVNDVADVSQWTGFHRIEQILWVKGTTRGAVRYADKLIADVTTLHRKVGTLNLQPAQLANGATELLNEVATSKITGEEDRYSHTDLSDLAANLAGAKQAFDLLAPALDAQGEGSLAAEISRRFEAVKQGLDVYRRSTPLGYALYGELTPADRKRLAQLVDALAEPLSTVAAKVAT